MPEKVTITKNKLDSLAEVIGSKSNQNVPLTIEGMEDAVLSLITPIGTKSITENGTYDVTEYANANVDVLDKLIITPTYTYNSNDGPIWTIDKIYDEVDAAYTAGKTIMVDAKVYDNSESVYNYYNATFLPPLSGQLNQPYAISIAWFDGEVNKYLEQFYVADSSNKSWILNSTNEYEYPKQLIEKTITANGIYDSSKNSYLSGEFIDGYSKVTVNVPPTTLQSLTIIPSTEQQIFNASSQMSDTALFTCRYTSGSSQSFPIELTIGTNY